MGIGGISVWQLLIILMVVILVFGTSRIRQLGEDLGGFLKGMRGAAKELEDLDDWDNDRTELSRQHSKRGES